MANGAEPEKVTKLQVAVLLLAAALGINAAFYLNGNEFAHKWHWSGLVLGLTMCVLGITDTVLRWRRRRRRKAAAS